jgi:hypothetical protein
MTSRTGYFTHPDCRKHEMGRGHPECPERLDAINDHLLYIGLLDNLSQQTAPLANLEVLELAHSKRHIASMDALNDALVQEIASGGSKKYAQIDPDTAMNTHTWSAVPQVQLWRRRMQSLQVSWRMRFVPFGRQVTMPSMTVRWVSASSTVWLLPPSMR